MKKSKFSILSANSRILHSPAPNSVELQLIYSKYITLGARGFFFFSKEAKRSERTGGEEAKKKTLWSRPVQTSLPCDFETKTARQTGFLDTSVCGAATRKTARK